MSGEDRLKDHPDWVIDRQGTKMVLYKGLLHLAHQDGLKSIRTAVVQCPSETNGRTCIVHAEVETAKGVFEGIGDASPANVTKLIVAHLIRMAETRAKARALRDALDIGFVAAEELGEQEPSAAPTRPAAPRRAQSPVWPDGPSTGNSGDPRPLPDLASLRAEYDNLRGQALGRGLSPKALPDEASPVIAQKWIASLRERMGAGS